MFLDENEYWYNRNKDIQCISDRKPILVKGINNKYEMFGGNSKATAKFSGLVSKFFTQMNDVSIDKIEEYLYKFAKKNEWNEITDDFIDDHKLECKKYSEQQKKILSKILIDMSCENIKENDLRNTPLYENIITPSNIMKILEKIQYVFHIDIDYSKVTIYDFYSINTLLQLINLYTINYDLR